MAQMENIIRPFVGEDVTPTPVHQANATNVPPVRFSVGIVGGTKTFSYSGSSTLTNYMAAVHTEAESNAFNMSTGQLN